MERAPLRPVPARPAGPVDPAAAVREVAAALPALGPLEVRAFALVALADRPRAKVAGILGLEQQELGVLLAAARKELRQTLVPLSGSGWCERAEGLISDRLDGVVDEPATRRLDVHLRNCTRCVEHERRLVQATDALLAGIAPARPSPAPPTSDAPLTAVPPEGGEPTAVPPADEAATDEAPTDEAPTDTPAVLPPAELPSADTPAELPSSETPAEHPSADTPAELPSTDAFAELPTADAPAELPSTDAPAELPTADTPAELPPAGAPAVPSSEQIAAAAEVLVTVRTRRQLAAAITWNAMIAIAVLLTIASIALAIAGALGAEL